ncbi:hypothetical protein L6V77_25920 [Myxococcota bacterium]|nr:hypothetical protein [Myxococcota bacterium]
MPWPPPSRESRKPNLRRRRAAVSALSLALAWALSGCDLPDETPRDASAAGGAVPAPDAAVDVPDGRAPDPDAAVDVPDGRAPDPDGLAPTPDAGPAPSRRVAAMVGPEGGRVEHPGGAALDVPAGALGAPVEVSIEDTPPPEAAGASTPVGAAFILGPAGQTFAAPVRVTLPIPADAGPGPFGLFIAPGPEGPFAALETTVDGSGTRASAATTHFSVVLAATPPGTLLITSGPALPPGVVDVPYGPVALSATGGTPPYLWSLTGGSLPFGLELTPDGLLSGTPRDTASPVLQVRAADAAGAAVESVLSLQITREPLPLVTALVPDTAAAGSGPLELEIQGMGFAPGDLIRFDGEPLQTAFVSDASLTATLDALLLQAPGGREVTVERPGVGIAGPLAFTVTGGGAPVLVRLAPDRVAAGSADTQVQVQGGGFTAAAVAAVDGQNVGTGFVSDEALAIVVPAALLAMPGERSVTVTDVGGLSNALVLTVGDALPAGPPIQAVVPSRIFTGAGNTRLNVSGMNFDPAGVLTLDGIPLATEFFHPGGVAGVIPGAVVAVPGVHSLRYENPPGAGGAGAAVELTFVDLPFGPLRTLDTTAGAIYGVAADETHAYWADWTTGEVRRAPLGGGASELVANGQARPYAVAIDATTVYWTNESFGLGQGELVSAPKAGGMPVRVATGLSGPHNVALDGTHAWLAEMWSAQLSRVPLAGGAVEVIAAGLDGMSGLDVDATHVYFGPSDVQSGVRRLPRDAAPGDAPEIVAARQAPYDLDVGPSGSVFWVDQFARQVMRLEPGGRPTVFASGLSAPHFLAEHAGYVFIGDRSGGLFAQALDDDARVFVGNLGAAPWDMADAPGGLVVSFNSVVAFLPDAP